MNLTEVLLAVIVSLAVLAGGYTLYNSVSDKNAVSATMQNLSLLRANIDDLYAGNYAGLASDAADGTLHKTGVLPDALADLSDGGKPASKWGAIDIEGTDDGSGYTIAFEGLGKDVCMHLGRFQYRTWAKVEAGETAVWTRGTDTALNASALASACKDGNVTLTFTAP
ncbi:MAG: hypothetical protein IKX75_03660 [Desulfovibrio sp.]|nr:hypothetical protein [Desulfovibrio sp.]